MSRILYIEDDKTLRESCTTILQYLGHSVIPREDTDKADAIVDQWKPHLVITDHELGEGKETGLQMAKRLHADGIKVAVLSGSEDAFYGAEEVGIPFFMKPHSIIAVAALAAPEEGTEQTVSPSTGSKKRSSV